MLTVCWSVKGGVGATVTTAAMALASARHVGAGALLVDLAGDLPAALGSALGTGVAPGVAEWLAAGPGAPPDALTRLARPVEAEPRLHLLARGRGPLEVGRADLLASLLAASGRPVLVDAGRIDDRIDGGVGLVLAEQAERSLLVTSACLLALGRARDLAVRPTGVVLVREPTRALRCDDVERALGVPVVLELAVDPAVARAVDAGLLASRLPRGARGHRPGGGDMSVADAVHAALLAGPAGAAPGPDAIGALVRRSDPLLTAAAVARAVAAVQSRMAGLGPLDPLLADPLVTDVLVNGPGPVWVERDGRLLRTEVVLDRAQIDLLVERVVAPLGRRADPGSPVVDARLPDGSRVHVVVPPLAVDGPCVTIRRFAAKPIELEQVAAPSVAALLRWAVRARSNVVVSGGTGSGKTTLLNALGREIPAGERIVTVEDAAELRFPSDHVVRLEARTASAEGTGEVTCRDLVRSALRMRPDRLVVGEVRDATALDMVQAMNTGHDGSLSTVHANSCDDAVRRLETLVLLAGVGLSLDAVRDHLAAAVDLIVHLERAADGRRRVVEVAEVVAPGGAAPAGRRSTVVVAAGDRLVRPPVRSGRDLAAGPPPETGA